MLHASLFDSDALTDCIRNVVHSCVNTCKGIIQTPYILMVIIFTGQRGWEGRRGGGREGGGREGGRREGGGREGGGREEGREGGEEGRLGGCSALQNGRSCDP